MRLALIWHLHQPYYAAPGRERFELPWVRLHAAKSYLDMAAVLEAHPTVRCVANFSGALLEQLHSYVEGGWRDAYWELTLRDPASLEPEERRVIERRFFSLAHGTVLARFPRYRELLARRGDDQRHRLNDDELRDLQVLFNLGWCGFTLRDELPALRDLEARGSGFTDADKAVVLDAHVHALRAIARRWMALRQRGQIEIAVSPHYHPIMPLLCDSDVARAGLPDAPLPTRFHHPEDARAQLARALDTAAVLFGERPRGVWPSEGSVSEQVVAIAAEQGIAWLASDEEVLQRSRRHIDAPPARPHLRAWRLRTGGPALFFRDRTLSDLVGFRYSQSPADLAAADFVHRLEHLVGADADALATVILDGENAWEHYPDDGRAFLHAFYAALHASRVETVTPSGFLAEGGPVGASPQNLGTIAALHPGSWIDANFRIWIGSPVKNRAWELLTAARAAVAAAGPNATSAAREALFRAEGSDWFWWFGDDFHADEKDLFDRLFRQNLMAAYHAAGLEAPEELAWPVAADGVRARGTSAGYAAATALVSPPVDGRQERALHWLGAAVLRGDGSAGSMYEGSGPIAAARIGFDDTYVYARFEPRGDRFRVNDHWQVVIRLGEVVVTVSVDGDTVAASRGEAALDWALDWRATRAALDLEAGEEVACWVAVDSAGITRDRLPREGAVWLEVPDEAFAGRHWLV